MSGRKLFDPTTYVVKSQSMVAGPLFVGRRQSVDTQLRLLKKQSRTADWEWSDILGTGLGLTKSNKKTNKSSHMASELDDLCSHVQNCSR